MATGSILVYAYILIYCFKELGFENEGFEVEISRCGGFFWIKGMGKKSIKSAGVLKWVFENIRKCSKTFKNIQKYSNFEWKRSKIFDE